MKTLLMIMILFGTTPAFSRGDMTMTEKLNSLDISFVCKENPAIEQAFYLVEIDNYADYAQEFSADCLFVEKVAKITHELNEMTEQKDKFYLQVSGVGTSSYFMANNALFLAKYDENILYSHPSMLADDPFFSQLSTTRYVHEYGHLLFFNWLAAGQRNPFYALLKTKRDEKIRSGLMARNCFQLLAQAEKNNEKRDALRVSVEDKCAELGLLHESSVLELQKTVNKASRETLKLLTLGSYQEIFSDILALLYTGYPSLISKGYQLVMGDSESAKNKYYYARDFTINHDLMSWESTQEHERFAPVRYHFYKNFYKADLNKSEKLKILKILFNVILDEIAKYPFEEDCHDECADQDAKKNIEMNQSFIEALNKRMIL